MLQSFWVIGFLALAISLGVNTMLILKKSSQFIAAIKQPKEVIFEGSSAFWHFRTREIDALVRNLKEGNMRVSQKEKELNEMNVRISAEKKELERLKTDIVNARMELSDRILETEATEQKNLKSLADTYVNISPDSVVKLFAEMDDSLVVKIMAFMPTESMAPILESMVRLTNADDTSSISAQRAARLTELYRLNLSSKK